jgi:gluconolactonase
MTWKFNKVGGSYQGAVGGLAWDGGGMLASVIDEGRIVRIDAKTGKAKDYRLYANKITGIAFGPDGLLYGAQDGGRRVIQFQPDGSANVTGLRLDGKIHNHPNDLVLDQQGRIWFADPYSPLYAFGPQIFPYLPHQSVLRIERDERRAWKIRRVTHDTVAPRAVLLSADEKTLYVADGGEKSATRELRAYPVNADGGVGRYTVLHSFGADHRGAHRGIEGLCLDSAGNIIACAGSRASGPGPLVYVFTPGGAILESHAVPGDSPMRCAFGEGESLYVSTGDGRVWRARNTGRKAAKRW